MDPVITSATGNLYCGVIAMSELNGWIKCHRKVLNWEWFKKPNMFQLFTYLVLKANHKEGVWQGHTIKRGQLITGRHTIREETGISEQSIKTCLKHLKKTGEINQLTNHQFSVITICNYESYQSDSEKSTNELTNDQPTPNRPLTTNKKNKNDKNEEVEVSVPLVVGSETKSKSLKKPKSPVDKGKWMVSVSEWQTMFPEPFQTVEVESALADWLEYRKQRGHKVNQMEAQKNAELLSSVDPVKVIDWINKSIASGWHSIKEPFDFKNNKPQQSASPMRPRFDQIAR
jgi:biotin operon repressor